MAVFLNNKVGVKINSVDLSDHVTSITLNRTFDELEVTAMGDTAHKFVKGLEASSVTIDFLNDTYTVSLLVNNTTDINGAVGDMSTQSITFTANSTVAVATTGTF